MHHALFLELVTPEGKKYIDSVSQKILIGYDF